MKQITTLCVAIAAVLWVSQSPLTAQGGSMQAPATQSQPAMQAQEIYHVHFVKAAPGKVRELADAYLNTPATAENPEPPIVLRHLQGDDWDLAVITPLGKEETLRAAPLSAQEQQANDRMRTLRVQHSDTFTLGPAWMEARAALLGASRASPASGQAVGTAGQGQGPENNVYIVTVYRSLPGHRDQLASVLRRIAAIRPENNVTLQHMEGSPWEFVMVSRYESWNAIADDPPMERLKSQGFANQEAQGLELRQHVAEHRDTIAERVGGSSKPVR